MPVDSLTYQLVYDASAIGLRDWWFPGLGMVAVVLGGILASTRQLRQRTHNIGVAMIGLGVIWAMTTGSAIHGGYRDVRDALREGRYTLVTGTVRGFVPGDRGDKLEEQWCVVSAGREHCYGYSPSRLEPGYRRSQPYGGAVREGTRVRVADVDGRIARLEIAR